MFSFQIMRRGTFLIITLVIVSFFWVTPPVESGDSGSLKQVSLDQERPVQQEGLDLEFKSRTNGYMLSANFVGGSAQDSARAIGFDAAGNVYVAGVTTSSDFPLKNPVQERSAGNDLFIVKLSSDRKRLLYSTYLGGTGQDFLRGMAVHPSGQVWLTGTTNSTDFPILNSVQQRSGGTDGFVVKLNSSGKVVFSSYIGGSGRDQPNSISIKDPNTAYITGVTFSADFPVTKMFGVDGNAFVAKVNSAGRLVYSLRIGGTGGEEGTAITLDRSGFVYVCGWVSLPDNNDTSFPLTSDAFDLSFNGVTDAFVLKLTPDGSRLAYSTFIGGGLSDKANYIAVRDGHIYISGTTFSQNFPLKKPVHMRKGLEFNDIFVSVLDSQGRSLIYSTYYGGSKEDAITGFAVDREGTAYLTGFTKSADVPIINKIAGAHGLMPGCLQVAFLSKIPPFGTRLLLSSYLGFSGCDGYSSRALSVRGSGAVYLAGDAYFPDLTRLNDAFVLRIFSNAP